MKKKTKSFLSLMAATLAMVNLSSCSDEVSTNIKEYDPNPVVIVPEPIMNNGHECVDLGCSVYWSDANVGSETPNGQGWYFAWGGLVVHTSDVSDGRNFGLPYEFATQLDNQNLINATKYNDTDNKTTLELADDAARVNWGGTWRIPTKGEFQELIDSCYWEWTNNYKNTKKKGFIVFKAKNDEDKGAIKYDGGSVTRHDSGKTTSLKGSYNINNITDTCIFLPATGYRREHIFENDNKEGNYWTSTVYNGHKAFAYSCTFYNQRMEISDWKRVYGCNVRAVCEK